MSDTMSAAANGLEEACKLAGPQKHDTPAQTDRRYIPELRKMRETFGITLDELAASSGYAVWRIREWEAGDERATEFQRGELLSSLCELSSLKRNGTEEERARVERIRKAGL